MKLEITITNGDITTIRSVPLGVEGMDEAQYFARMLLSKLPIEAWVVKKADRFAVVIESDDVQVTDNKTA